MKEPEAYQAMFRFLDDYYSRLPSDGLGQLLSEMQLADDGKPFDPAITEDWNAAVAAIQAEREAVPVPLRKAS
jgi:hypothetical protein